MLLKGTDDLIKYLGRAVNASTTDDFLMPYIQQAQEEILERAVGEALVTQVDGFYNQQQAEPPLTEYEQAHCRLILPKMQKVVAWFGYLKYLPFAIGSDGDNGLQELGSDTTNPVRIGVLDKRIRESERNAASALEALLVFLENNPDKYSAYHDSPVARETRQLLVPSATAMSEFLPIIDGNYRLFLNLRPYIRLAERDYILPKLGRGQYDALKTKLKDKTPLSADEAQLLYFIRRALSHTAYWIALPNLQFVMLSNGNIRVLSDYDGIYNQKAIDNQTIISLAKAAETEAKKHQNVLKGYLIKNVELFPLYAADAASQETAVNRLPDNSSYKSIFRMK